MSHASCRWWLIAAPMFVLSSARCFAAPPTFQFHPPDGTTYVVTVRTTRTVTLGSLGAHTVEHEIRQRVRVTRTADGFSLAATGLDGALAQDGQKVDDPSASMLTGVIITTAVDRQGKLKEIRGFQQAVQKLQSALAPEARLDPISAGSVAEAMGDHERQEWYRRVGKLIGQDARIGNSWQGTDSIEWPEARAKIYYRTAARVEGREKYATRECVRIRFTYFQGPAPNAAQPAQEEKSRTGESAKSKPAAASDSPLQGGSDLLVDPLTMLIYAESRTLTVHLPVQIPGQGKVPGTLVEKTEYRYQYE